MAREIQFDEQVFVAGSVVATDLDLQVYRLSYLYSIYQTPRTDLALAAGVYAFDTGFFMKSNIGVQESEDATAGFPAFGLKVMHAFDPTYTLMAGVQYFAVNEDDVEGDLLDVVIAAEGAFWKKLAAGFGYNVVEIFGEDTEDKDKVEYDFSGFLLYLKYRF